MADLKPFVQMLKDTSAVVEKALAAGKTLDQMKQDKILDPWQKWSGDFIKEDAFIETLYYSLSGKPGATYMKHN